MTRVGRVEDAFVQITRAVASSTPDWVVIEDAYGPAGRARKALDLVTGAVIAAVDGRHSQVKLLKASEWRSYLGAKNTKLAGHEAVCNELAIPFGEAGEDMEYDEHELDALGVALGWAAKLKQGDVS